VKNTRHKKFAHAVGSNAA